MSGFFPLGAPAPIEILFLTRRYAYDANGNTVIYKDDGTTPAFSVTSAITDDSTTTTRKRME